MNERLKLARKALHLTQADLGKRIGVTNSAIALLERGERNFTDQMILALCKEYNINEDWLRYGTGEMFTYSEENSVSRLVQEYGLDDFAARALLAYQKLTPANRNVIKQYVLSVAAAYGAEVAAEMMPEVIIDGKTITDPKAAAELSVLARDIEREKRAGERSSASHSAIDA